MPPEVEPESWLRRLHAGAGRANASAGAGVVEQPGPGGDGRNGQPGSVRSARSHEADYPAETIVMQEADVGENEAAAMFEEVTGLGAGLRLRGHGRVGTLRVGGSEPEWIAVFLGRSETVLEFVRCDRAAAGGCVRQRAVQARRH